MSVIQIRKAQREGARLVIGLAGVSGSGKTRTAIELAYGLSNYQPGKIGFLDTENRRGSLYADVLQRHATHPTNEAFLIGDLYPPFSPQRYIEAIEEFAKAGVEVLVIDSASHEWEGEGGCQEIAEGGNPKLPNWQFAKKLHKKFVNKLLQCDMHIIVCLRAREKAKPEKQIVDGREKTVYVDLGMQPITEKNFMFEMTASLMMHDQGTRQDVTKCPADLMQSLGRGKGYITSADGKALRDWVDGAKQLDPRVEAWRNRLLTVTDQGRQHVESCWAQVPAGIQKALGKAFLDQLLAAADAYEQQALGDPANDNQPAMADLNAVVAAGAGGHAVAPPIAPVAAPIAAPIAEPVRQPEPDPQPDPAAKPARRTATAGSARAASNPAPTQPAPAIVGSDITLF